MNDTICAISTSLGIGSISIIRVSGNDAIKIVNSIFKGKNLNNVNSHTINYGYILDKDEIVDEVLVSIMKKPKTFTMEDVVEINCHGGISTTNHILETLISNGCRLAEPGEFTKRAFLNGRIDLMEAESVMDLIDAKNDKARRASINQLRGMGSNLIKELREKIITIVSNIEVNIDYPEYEDIYEYTKDDLEKSILDIKNKLEKIVNEYKDGLIVKEGIKTVIVGRPNVGKSSLLNKLLNYEKAIVTDIPGTTRDIVEGSININGISLNIIDTAGIRETKDIVEEIGVKKSLDFINEADLVLVVLNNNEELSKDDIDLLEKTKNKTSIVIINKNDLISNIDLNLLNNRELVYTNTISNDGINTLKNKIVELFNLEKIDNSDFNYITNARQIGIIRECLNSVNDICIGLNNDVTLDMLEIDLKNIWNKLGEIIGETYSEELLDELFSRFCVGK